MIWITLRQEFFHRRKFLCLSNEVGVNPYDFFYRNREIQVVKNGDLIATTDGKKYLNYRDVCFKRKGLLLKGLYSEAESLVFDWTPSDEKQTILLKKMNVIYGNDVFKIINNDGYNILTLTKVDIGVPNHIDIDLAVACLAFFWLHHEIERITFG